MIPGQFRGHVVSWHGSGPEGRACRTDFPGTAMRLARFSPVLLAGFVIVVLCRGNEPAGPTASGPVPAVPSQQFRGSGSCSAVACHGSIKSFDRSISKVRRDEHTTWMSDDAHSRAFQVLFDERSERIERSLANSEGG